MQEYKVTVDSEDTVRWYNLKTDKYHREGGPAVEYADGTKSWYLNGRYHRVDGPACDSSSFKSWWLNGKRHRTDGPAVEWADGTKAWYLNDVEYTEKQFNSKMNPSSCEGKEIEIDGVTYTLKVKE